MKGACTGNARGIIPQSRRPDGRGDHRPGGGTGVRVESPRGERSHEVGDLVRDRVRLGLGLGSGLRLGL
jgi:hypothetical protein